MSRQRITEFRSKTLLYEKLGQPYSGIQIKLTEQLPLLPFKKHQKLALKVDQGVKKRMKQGLVLLNLTSDQLSKQIQELAKRGYSQFLLEPMETYKSQQEQYLALQQVREGVMLTHSSRGGIEVESKANLISKLIITDNQPPDIPSVPQQFISDLLHVFTKNHISFLEINPLVITNNQPKIIDLAVEIDTAGEFFVNQAWNSDDFVTGILTPQTEEEQSIEELARQSQASFKFQLFEPNGSIFVLLSGGGASIVIADQIYDQQYGPQLANYGEYSGNPNDQETYFYTKNILSLLLKSTAPRKALIIAGGVANFTDIRKTFSGIIRAINEHHQQLQAHNTKVFVRRGGPFQQEGLQLMNQFLKNTNLFGFVAGPEMPLTEIVSKTIQYIKQ